MAGIRFLNNGRLILPSGASLHGSGDCLAPSEALDLLTSADVVIHHKFPNAYDITGDPATARSLMERVNDLAAEICATRYAGSGLTVLVFNEYC